MTNLFSRRTITVGGSPGHDAPGLHLAGSQPALVHTLDGALDAGPGASEPQHPLSASNA